MKFMEGLRQNRRHAGGGEKNNAVDSAGFTTAQQKSGRPTGGVLPFPQKTIVHIVSLTL